MTQYINIIIVIIGVFLMFFSSSFVYADNNGVWHYAEDVRAGVFGQDEGLGLFEFKSRVDFDEDVKYKDIELDARFVNENQVNSITSFMIVDGDVRGVDLEHSYKIGSAYDTRFVNENQADSVTSSMIVDGDVRGVDLEHSYKIGSAYDYRFINKAGDRMSGNLNMGRNQITNVAHPVSNRDVATKKYVDDIDVQIFTAPSRTHSEHKFSNIGVWKFCSLIAIGDMNTQEHCWITRKSDSSWLLHTKDRSGGGDYTWTRCQAVCFK